MQCEGFTTVTNTGATPQDVVFQFPNDPTNPTYSELGYLMDYQTYKGVGFRTNSIIMLWQKTSSGVMPAANDWSYYNINNYLGTNGCLTMGGFQSTCENFQLHSETAFYSLSSTSFTGITGGYTIYALTQEQIGDIIISSGGTLSGTILKPASSLSSITVDGMYYQYPTTVSGTTDGRTFIAFKTSTLHSGLTVLQFNYLVGTANTSATVRQDITVPTSLTGYDYTNGIYNYGGHVALTLNKQPNNSVVWVFYNGQLVSSNNYGVYTTGTTVSRKVLLSGFTPIAGSRITLYYLDSSGLGTTPTNNKMTITNINNLRVNIDNSFLKLSASQIYNLNNFISLPIASNINGFTFGDEVSFFGNIETDIKATIYKTLMTCNVLPNKFINSANPTFNSTENKVALTEIGIYDSNDDLVAIGKFSQPLVRKYNSDMLIIQASIDF
jgi:hypothetical protein